MKMVKSLLLGSATGLVAIAGAQAADLPVKAKPVQYVKICSLYGVGFYYIPGTDTCIKIGGWMRTQYDYGMDGSTTHGPFSTGFTNRSRDDSVWRTRGYLTADVRSPTPYGTVRVYMDVGLIHIGAVGSSTGGLAANTNRGFIQWAGFTFGQATSFFDIYSGPAVSYIPAYPQSQTGGGGWMVAGYTAQFGNGFSGSLAAEIPRQSQILGEQGAAAALIAAPFGVGSLAPTGGGPSTGYGGFQSPDIVGNLRVDQAWGSAQIMGALHPVNAMYYQSSGAFTGLGAGHPGDRWGYAIGGGLKLNTPMIGHGDYFQTQVNYTEGASMYVFSPQIMTTNLYLRDGDTAAYGIRSDAVYGGTIAAANTTGLNLTTTWGLNASFEHHWNPQWKTSVYGGYAEVNYNGQANAILCSLEGGGNAAGFGSGAVATAGCDNDWSFWHIGSRTQWNITKDFYMGVDVLYSALNSATTWNGLLPASQTGTPAGSSTFVGDQDAWSFEFRVHKNFYP